MKVGLLGWVVLSCVAGLLVSACGGSDDEIPDSGYGKLQPVPAMSCEALCVRQGDCGEHICNEDTNSMKYTGLGTVITSLCKSACTESQISAQVDAATWACLFQSSCRAVLAHDACHIQASYQCQ